MFMFVIQVGVKTELKYELDSTRIVSNRKDVLVFEYKNETIKV